MVLVQGATQHNTKAEQVANLSNLVLCLLSFFNFKEAKQKKKKMVGKQQGSRAACTTAGKAKCVGSKQNVTELKINK